MALTDLQLCSRALIKIGAAQITSFTSGSAESDIASALYSITRDALLSAYPWNFALKKATLSQSSTPPVSDFQYAYTLPTDYLRAISAGNSNKSRGSHYHIVGNALHTNESVVVLSYIYRANESDFPPFFASVLIAQLAAEFCIPLTENSARADALYKIAADELKKARSIDAQQDSPKRIDSFSLIDARG